MSALLPLSARVCVQDCSTTGGSWGLLFQILTQIWLRGCKQVPLQLWGETLQCFPRRALDVPPRPHGREPTFLYFTR